MRPMGSKRKHWLVIVIERSGLARAILFLAARDNPYRIVGQRTLQFEGLQRISQQPQIHLLRRRQDGRRRCKIMGRRIAASR